MERRVGGWMVLAAVGAACVLGETLWTGERAGGTAAVDARLSDPSSIPAIPTRDGPDASAVFGWNYAVDVRPTPTPVALVDLYRGPREDVVLQVVDGTGRPVEGAHVEVLADLEAFESAALSDEELAAWERARFPENGEVAPEMLDPEPQTVQTGRTDRQGLFRTRLKPEVVVYFRVRDGRRVGETSYETPLRSEMQGGPAFAADQPRLRIRIVTPAVLAKRGSAETVWACGDARARRHESPAVRRATPANAKTDAGPRTWSSGVS